MASGCALAVVAVLTVVAVFLRESDTGVLFRTSDQVAMILLGLLIGAGIMLWATPRVRADAEGIEVRNILTRRRFVWSDVLSISFPDGASWARLELPHDEYYSVMAVQAVDREYAVAAVRALRKLHYAAWTDEHPG
ncbi:MAG: PH domain-containing protein, partial [Thermocrispum sp.]